MKYIKGFDGIRGFSILCVLLTHVGLFSLFADDSFIRQNYSVISGETGVMIFFTLSGFLITLLLLKEKKATGRIHFTHFFIRRFLRLAPPLLLFFIIIGILMSLELIPKSYSALLLSFFYLFNFAPFHYHVYELGHTWSLSVEEQFYLLWPFIIHSLHALKKIYVCAGLLILLCVIWTVLYPSITFQYEGQTLYLSHYFYLHRWFIPACLPIMIGAIAGMVFFSYPSLLQQRFYKQTNVLLLCLLLFLTDLYLPSVFSPLYTLLRSSGVALFLLWIALNQESIIVSCLEWKPLSFLGKISYGVYVYQGLFLRTGPGGTLAIQQFPLNIVLVFCTALLSYYLVEKKMMQYKKKWTFQST